MKRRSRAGGEPIKGRRQKAPKPKRRNAPKAVARSNSPPAQEETEVARLTRELNEALEQQTATSEVLRVISSSPGDLQPVFEAMLKNAVRICDAKFGNIYRWDGDGFHLVATHNAPPAFAEYRRRTPLRPGPNTASGRMVATKAIVHVADVAAETGYIERRDPVHVAGVELGGARTILVVPMLKEHELIGAFSLLPPGSSTIHGKQIALVRTSPPKPSLPSRTRGCSTNCARTSDLTESLEQQTATRKCCKSSPAPLAICSPYLQRCCRRRCAFATPLSVISTAGTAMPYTSSPHATHHPPLPNGGASPMQPAGPETVPGRLLESHEVVHVTDRRQSLVTLTEAIQVLLELSSLGACARSLAVPMLQGG